MDEGNGRSSRARPGSVVDDVAAFVLDGLQGSGAIGYAITDVVKALTALFEVLGHGRVGPRRREELDERVGDSNQRLLDAVALDHFAMLDLGAEHCAVPL